MKSLSNLQPVSRDLMIKIYILRTMMYCGVLWGLFHQGWAIKSDQEDFIFPFGLMAYRHIATQKSIGHITNQEELHLKISMSLYYQH